ncbi:MAG: ADP-ribosylglycohydrolase family protein [Deltaproteobacteria bacterium]|nr:ADP-ribosylglycohydrolase family protein [Deltaproteobacteria bacterium]
MSDESRCRGAIYGLFIGDALAMPVHWYYDTLALQRDYGRVTDYVAPRNPHPDSILWRSSYTPLNEKANILHEQAQYWGKRGIHYHQFLQAGENTLNVKLCGLLIESLNANRGYSSEDYLKRYIAFMTTSGNHRDTYVEEYHRHFFTHYAQGKPTHQCGVTEKHIGGLVGLVPIVVYYRASPSKAREAALEHLSLTHLGQKMTVAADLLIQLLLEVLSGDSLREALLHQIGDQKDPLYAHPYGEWLAESDEKVVGRRLSTACYVEDSVPSVVYLALKYHDQPEQGLIVNTNLGGDNVHRGAVLGAILGAANGLEGFPQRWTTGLRNPPPELVLRETKG